MWPPWLRARGQETTVVPLVLWLRDGARSLLRQKPPNTSVHLGHWLSRGYQSTRLSVGAANISNSTRCLADQALERVSSTFDLVCTTDNLTAAARVLATTAGLEIPQMIKWDRHHVTPLRLELRKRTARLCIFRSRATLSPLRIPSAPVSIGSCS